jgi:hypothetical protein
MPLLDDGTILADAVLLRVLPHPGWITNKGGIRRPSSIAFYEAYGEVSYFLDGPGVVAELRRIFKDAEIARVPVQVIRAIGFAIERRPDECPIGFRCDRSNHVVAGPAQQMDRNVYEKLARSIAKQPAVTIIDCEPETPGTDPQT